MNTAVRRHAMAWVALTLVLALHVADEAAHDFLGFYNPFVMMLRDVLLIQWLPTYEFGEWLAGLIMAVVLLLIASRAAFRGARWIQWASLPYGVIMLLNGCAHIGGSLYWQRMVPGVWSAPLLVIAGAWLLIKAAAALRA
ncbi:hypothetical protein [Paludibaculum fermentans]|uniref:hypothetical protein n=1 Tax=Paludibaculum fermentans TaxID=1473598 RepID=UPI003EBA971B